MRGLIFTLDSTLAVFFGIVAIAIGVQMISNVASFSHVQVETLERLGAIASSVLMGACFEGGGVAFCDGEYVRTGILDARVLSGYSQSGFLLKYAEDNNVVFKVGINDGEVSGAFCIARLLKVHGKDEEAVLKVCVDSLSL